MATHGFRSGRNIAMADAEPMADAHPPVAACIAGLYRTFIATRRNIFSTMVGPLGDQVETFFALDRRLDHYLHGTAHLSGNHTISSAAIRGSVARFRPVEVTILHSERLEHPLTVCFESVRRREQQRAAQYRWLLKLRPDVVYDRPLPAYPLWPAYHGAAAVRLVLTEFAESLHWWRAGACVKDVWNLMTRDAAPFLFSPCWGNSSRCLDPMSGREPHGTAARERGGSPPQELKLSAGPSGCPHGRSECHLGCSLFRNQVHVGVVNLSRLILRMSDPRVLHHHPASGSFHHHPASGAFHHAQGGSGAAPMAFRARFFCGQHAPALSAHAYELSTRGTPARPLPAFGTAHACSAFGHGDT